MKRTASAVRVRALVHKADFERVLAVAPRSRSAHFALHHLGERQQASLSAPAETSPQDLSTSAAQDGDRPVDNFSDDCWLGCVVPKRHARRAVTRNLLKRQIRAALARHHVALPGGLWLVRLKSPFATAEFPSAFSSRLRDAARAELDGLLQRAR